MSYNFTTLNDKEFELLARDILNAQFGLGLQSFKAGRDKGIDLRYSTSKNQNDIVVQAKHYAKSGYKAFYSALIKKELPNVKKLKPRRYILVTSVELSAPNKDLIFQKFKPYINSPNDILGSEDLNKYLSDLKDIETKWYKLWLSSVNVLDTILHNAVLGKSAFIEDSIKKNIKLYVHSDGYDDAFEILSKHKYILITGQPGVGKTTLANLLTYHYLAKKYQLIYIDSDLKEAEKIFARYPKKKQLFYFDDFLGSNYLEIHNPKTTESEFVHFLNRIKGSNNKHLILTTRTTILTNAIDRYEKMRRVRVDIARKEIMLGQYSDIDKARILYNHLYHSAISDDLLNEVFSNENYWKIIKHKNYNPRLIEFVTDSANIDDIQAGQYMPFVLEQLKNPQEVWRHAYEQQFTIEEKQLLHAVFSQHPNTQVSQTQMLFDQMLRYQVKENNYKSGANPFKNACKSLLDGILIRQVDTLYGRDSFSFINPSINDFLTNNFINNKEELHHLFLSSSFIEQFERYGGYFFDSFKPLLKRKDMISFSEMLIEKADAINALSTPKALNKRKYLNLRIATLLDQISGERKTKSIDNFCCDSISAFEVDDIDSNTRDFFVQIIENAEPGSLTCKYIEKNWQPLIQKLIQLNSSEDEFDEVEALFPEYNQDFNSFVKDNYRLVQEAVAEMVDASTSNWIEDEEDSIYSDDDVDDLKSKIKEKRESVFFKYNVRDTYYREHQFFSGIDFEELIAKNRSQNKKTPPQLINTQKVANESRSEQKERKAINDLFAR